MKLLPPFLSLNSAQSPAGVDVGNARLQVVVDHDPRLDRQAAALEETHLGKTLGRDDDQRGVDHLAVLGEDLQRVGAFLLHLHDLVAVLDPGAPVPDVVEDARLELPGDRVIRSGA
jgi:hypothetical protein